MLSLKPTLQTSHCPLTLHTTSMRIDNPTSYAGLAILLLGVLFVPLGGAIWRWVDEGEQSGIGLIASGIILIIIGIVILAIGSRRGSKNLSGRSFAPPQPGSQPTGYPLSPSHVDTHQPMYDPSKPPLFQSQGYYGQPLHYATQANPNADSSYANGGIGATFASDPPDNRSAHAPGEANARHDTSGSAGTGSRGYAIV